MKRVSIVFLVLFVSQVFAQEMPEKEVTTKVSEATVFLDGAQVVREKGIDLNKGKIILKFVGLSPFIDAKSIQVKVNGELMVLSVNHQQNYLDKMEKSDELSVLETKLETIEDKVKLENTYLVILQEELRFLNENRNIGGKNEQLTLLNLQQTSEFYGSKLTALKMKEIERRKTLEKLVEQQRDVQNQINTLTSKKEYPAGEILVKVDVKQNGRFSLALSYLVGNAGWFPSYDIRAKNINEPVQVIYKANVKQDTKVDWKDVKLKFSSADPNVSGVAPELQTYFLNYNTLPPRYKKVSNSVSGKVFDQNGEPLPGATIVVQGTTIGTVTDIDGNFSITIPHNASQLKFSFIGFNDKILPISNAVMNVALQESAMALTEVVSLDDSEVAAVALQGRVAGLDIGKSKTRIRGAKSYAMPTAQVENQTTVDFEIRTPYTINSDNKNYSVDMAYYDLPAFYQYYCVPKVDKDAFLIANIVDWEKYNLLEGEANVFFEDTYVGKTLMDVRFASDTLEISLGRDKRVSVNRKKIMDYTDRQFIGSKKEETRAWKTTVKNNKQQAIKMIVLDQVPVSTREEIEVSIKDISGTKHNEKTGIIKWEFELEPDEKEEFELKYAVKYPKNRNLIVE